MPLFREKMSTPSESTFILLELFNRILCIGVHLLDAGLIPSKGVKITTWLEFTCFELHDRQTFGLGTVDYTQIINKVDFLIILVFGKIFIFDQINLRNGAFPVLCALVGFVIFNIKIRSLIFGISTTYFFALV